MIPGIGVGFGQESRVPAGTAPVTLKSWFDPFFLRGLQIQIPFDCLVGDWSASIQTVSGGSMGRRRAEFKCRENVYILFNPWCEGQSLSSSGTLVSRA